MDECVCCCAPWSRKLEIDLWAGVFGVGWRQIWACTCTGTESGERADGRSRMRRTQVLNGEWVMDDGQQRTDGWVRTALQTRAHG